MTGTEDTSDRKPVLQEYISKVRAFKPNPRYYLVSVILAGMTMGVFRLLFNFFVLSLGYNEDVLGNLITVSNTTALIFSPTDGLPGG